MRVGFVNTRSDQNYEPFRTLPFGSLLLLTILEKEFGGELDLSFTDLRGVEKEYLLHHIPEQDVYLHYTTTIEFDEIRDMVNGLRQLYPKAKHIAGGPHCNIFPEQSAEVFDAICVGEGEEVIKSIIRDIRKGTLQKVYRQTARIDLNAYPFPSRRFLPKLAIVDKGLLTRKYYDLPGTNVLFSRGCPFSCHFCSNQYPGEIRFRSPELMAEEIEYLKREYGVKALVIKDDNGIPVNRNHAIRNIETLGKLGVMWRCQSRANGIGADILRLAKDAGCVEVTVAVESVWQKSLDIVNKRINVLKAKEYIKLVRQSGMEVKLLLIMGLPGEPKDIAQRTIEFIEETEPSNVALMILCPIPGSEIHRHPERFGIRINRSVPFSQYLFSFGRFDDGEKPPQLFEYENETPFGPSLTMDEIHASYNRVQAWLRDRKINF